MNFFGHAVVAAWADRRAAHVFGAMLPDFEGMAHVPIVQVRNPDIQRGVELHHRTDEAFHRNSVFLELTATSLDELSHAGVRRGTARAVAHIATEMFLDGCLAHDASHVEMYLVAIDWDADGQLQWKDGGKAYRALRGRLVAWGAPREYADPAFVLNRLRDALRRRPSLAILDQESERVAACLSPLRNRVEARSRELLDGVQDALGFGD